MKPKMHYQVQPREIAPPSGAPVIREQDQVVEEEIHNFLQAIESYPARAAKEPRISFHQHLSSLFAARSENAHGSTDGRRETRQRRH